MGGGIAQVFAKAGLDVADLRRRSGLTGATLIGCAGRPKSLRQQGLFEPGSAELVRNNLHAADSVAEAVAEADLIEEAVLERPEIKTPVLHSIEAGGPSGRRDRQQHFDPADW